MSYGLSVFSYRFSVVVLRQVQDYTLDVTRELDGEYFFLKKFELMVKMFEPKIYFFFVPDCVGR